MGWGIAIILLIAVFCVNYKEKFRLKSKRFLLMANYSQRSIVKT
jgi:hypothetical protein